MAQGRNVERRKGAVGSCARAQHAAALGRTVGWRRGAACGRARGTAGPRRGVACGCAGAQPGAGLGGSVGLSRGEAQGCVGAQRETAQGRNGCTRGVGLRRGKAQGYAGAHCGDAHGSSMELRRGVACGCAEAQCGAEPGRSAGLHKGRSVGLRWGVTWDYTGGSGLQGRLTTGFRPPCSTTSAAPGGCWRRAGARQRGTPHHRLLATPGHREHVTRGMLASGCLGGGPGITTGFWPGGEGRWRKEGPRKCAACGCAGAQRGAAEGCSVELRISAGWGCTGCSACTRCAACG